MLECSNLAFYLNFDLELAIKRISELQTEINTATETIFDLTEKVCELENKLDELET